MLWIFMSAGEVHSLYSRSRASRNSSRPTVHRPCCPHKLTRPWQWQTSKKKLKLLWIFCTFLWRVFETFYFLFLRVYLEHLIEPWAADGNGVQWRQWRFMASLANVFKLQHGVLTMANLSECKSGLKYGEIKHTCIALMPNCRHKDKKERKAVNKCKQCVIVAWLALSTYKQSSVTSTCTQY